MNAVKKKGVVKKKRPPEKLNANKKKPKDDEIPKLKREVPIADVRDVMNETIWRVQHEINPGMAYNDEDRLNSDELGYVLLLTMAIGAGVDGMKGGLKMRNQSAGEPVFCKEHN